MSQVRRLVSDGVDMFEFLVEDEGEHVGAARATPGMPGMKPDPMRFVDPAAARLFLRRVADDYTEKLAMRQVVARLCGREDMYEMSEEELTHWLAERLVSGAIRINRMEKG
jgi:hypothetical protein